MQFGTGKRFREALDDLVGVRGRIDETIEIDLVIKGSRFRVGRIDVRAAVIGRRRFRSRRRGIERRGGTDGGAGASGSSGGDASPTSCDASYSVSRICQSSMSSSRDRFPLAGPSTSVATCTT